MKKSSLKTFLKGENPYVPSKASLRGACQIGSGDIISQPGEYCEEACQNVPNFNNMWYCDVLEDGTAITYYID
jgi:hypothetical protein